MSEVHELTLREYYESFAQSLEKDFDEAEIMVSKICKKLKFQFKKQNFPDRASFRARNNISRR